MKRAPPATVRPNGNATLKEHLAYQDSSRVNHLSASSVLRLTREAPQSCFQAETSSPGALSVLKRLFDIGDYDSGSQDMTIDESRLVRP